MPGFLHIPAPAGAKALSAILSDLGIGAVLALDAGDVISYAGTGQTWADTSGSGNNFFLGTDATVQTFDPTFNGTAGSLAPGAYFSFDGGDMCRASVSFSNLWGVTAAHWTWLAMIYSPSGANGFFEAGANAGSTNINKSASNKLLVRTVAQAGAPNWDVTSTLTIPSSDWVFLAVTCNASDYDIYVNNSSENLSRFSSNTISHGGFTYIGLGQGAYAVAGTRIGLVGAVNSSLNSTQISGIYTELKKRYPSLP